MPSSEPSPSTPGAAGTFDREYVWQLFDGDVSAVCELLALVVRDVPRSVSSLIDRVRADDLATAARIGHSLRGTVGNVGGAAVSEIASAIEEGARKGEAGAMPALCAALEAATAALLGDLEAWARELGAAHPPGSEAV